MDWWVSLIILLFVFILAGIGFQQGQKQWEKLEDEIDEFLNQ